MANFKSFEKRKEKGKLMNCKITNTKEYNKKELEEIYIYNKQKEATKKDEHHDE